MHPNLAKVFFSFQSMGEKLCSNFVDEKLFGEVSVWEPLKKTKLFTFNINEKSRNVNMREGEVNIKQERKLMSRFIVAYRTWQDIDL